MPPPRSPDQVPWPGASPRQRTYSWAHLVAAAGVLTAALKVCIKIGTEHREYEKANRARAEIGRKLSTLPDGVGELIQAVQLESRKRAAPLQ